MRCTQMLHWATGVRRMNDPQESEDLQRWLSAAASDSLTPEDHARLFDLLRRDPVARRWYLDHQFTHADLHWEFPNAAVGGRAIEATFRVARSAPWRRIAQRVAIAALLLLTIAFGWWSLGETPAARITALNDAFWDGTAPTVGSALRDGQTLRLECGLARLRFASGAQLVVQAPATWTVVDGSTCRLDEGRVVAHATPGFQVTVRGVTVRDRGTEFAVSANEDEIEVHVFAGAVQVDGLASEHSLTATQALHIAATGAVSSRSARPDGFVRRLPDDGTPTLEPVPMPPAAVATVLLAAISDANGPDGLPARQLLDRALRHVFITDAIDGWHYLTGQTPKNGSGGNWSDNDGIRLWRSRDLRTWEYLGLVWSLERDATWARERRASTWTHLSPDGERWRGVWGPELHRIRGTWYIPYSMSYGGVGILRSISGRPEGPYRDCKTDGPLTDNIMPSLVEDTDGSVLLLWGDRHIARLNDDFSALAETPRRLEISALGWSEGPQLRRMGDRWLFTAGTFTNRPEQKARYDTCMAWGTSPYGPFTVPRILLPHGGHGQPFQDATHGWWATAFNLPGLEHRPAIVPLQPDAAEGFLVSRPPAPVGWRWTDTDPGPEWTQPLFDDRSWHTDPPPTGSAVTRWWRRTVDLPTDRTLILPRLYGRLPAPTEVFVDGVPTAHLTTAMSGPRALLLPNGGRPLAGAHVVAVRSPGGQPDLGLIDLDPTPTVVQGIAFHGAWSMKGRAMVSEHPLAVATWQFTGRGARLVHRAGPDGGRITVVIDGRVVTTMDTWAAGAEPRQSTPLVSDLEPGPHTVQLLVTGTSAPQSTGARVQIVELQAVP
jgi:ferric-dicitrate binding protein FerR (iron transport regulator)